MNCPRCNAAVPDGAQHCSRCPALATAARGLGRTARRLDLLAKKMLKRKHKKGNTEQ